MRIRKNAKISGFIYTNSNIYYEYYSSSSNANASSINHETNCNKLCNLNQSPWDIMTFPSSSLSYSPSRHPHHQFDDFETHYNINVDEYWSSVDYIEDIQSVGRVTFNKILVKCECDNGNVDDANKDYELNEKKDDVRFMKEDEGIVKCSNNIACNIMWEDHLVDPQEDAIWVSNKKARPVSKSTTSRTKKRVVAKTSNPDEYYYYSGFGPSWGKKRGELGNEGTTNYKACDTDFTINSSISEAIGGICDLGNIEKEHKRVEPNTTMNGTSWSGEVEAKRQDLDYMDEKQDDVKQKIVKKRRERPIKERSLKSLM